ncbi:hypothetical protein [Acetobacterium bakii]|nr:hypothetical protein [Acetobacterium bakii]
MDMKKFVPVIAKFEEDGNITPMQVLWEDERILKLNLFFISGPGLR